MPLPDVRVVIVGRAKADADFSIVEVTAREAQRLAKAFVRDAERVKRQIQAALRGR